MSDSRQGVCIALGVVFLILPVLAVGARTWAMVIRKTGLNKTGLYADDYFIFAALIFAEATGATMLYAAVHGNLGQRLTYSFSPVIPDQIDALVVFLKAEYVLSLFAQLSILCSKLSLLSLYRRIFITPTFRLAVVVVGSIVVVWHTIFILLFLLQCLPVPAVWNFELAATAKCLDKLAIWEAYAISDVLTDTLVLSLPVPAILSLQMTARKKFGVSLIFLLGTIVIGTGIARTIFFFIIAKESLAQITYNSAPCMYWSFLETSLAVVGACLPTLRPLFNSEGNDTFISRVRGFMSLSGSKSNGSQSRLSSSHASDVDQSFTSEKTEVFVSRSIAIESS